MTRRGFTLIELMVTVAIIGILSSLAVVSARGFVLNGRVVGEAESLASFLRNSRLRAIATGCPHVVRYTGVSATYGIAYPGATTIGSDHGWQGFVVMYRKNPCQLNNITELIRGANDAQVNQYVIQDTVATEVPVTGVLDGVTYFMGFDGLGRVFSAVADSPTTVILPGGSGLTVGRKTSSGTRDPNSLTRRITVQADGTITLK